MPSPETVKSIIYMAYNFSFLQLQQLIKETISISLTMDLWTSRSYQGYLGITGLFLDQKFELRELTLDISYVKYPHTGEHIQDTLENVLAKWEIQDLIYTITTDSRSNIKKAILNMENIKWLGCTSHTLQLVIKKGMKPAKVLVARVK
jgi:hypothetical protein